uniref:(northern house mosquito) hypothetical protein n=1 Tax=Culex pipiens TaxID=7175 RepID=A0A8D8B1A4_CULPI
MKSPPRNRSPWRTKSCWTPTGSAASTAPSPVAFPPATGTPSARRRAGSRRSLRARARKRPPRGRRRIRWTLWTTRIWASLESLRSAFKRGMILRRRDRVRGGRGALRFGAGDRFRVSRC